MKKVALSFVLAFALALATSGTAMATVIAQWNYNDHNNTVDVGAGTITAVGTATLSWATPGGGSNTDPQDPASSSTDYAMRITWGATEINSGAKWAVSTSGNSGIWVGFHLVRSSSGTASPLAYTYGYSTDAGSSWTNTSFTVLDNESWNYFVIDLSSIAAVQNNANFQFRILANESGRTQYGYIDYFTVATPIPAAAWLLGSGLLGLVAIRRRMKK